MFIFHYISVMSYEWPEEIIFGAVPVNGGASVHGTLGVTTSMRRIFYSHTIVEKGDG